MKLFLTRALLCGILVLTSHTAHALVVLDVLKDGYVEDYEPSGVLDGIPDNINDTNALLAGKIIVSNGTAIDGRSIITYDLSSFLGQDLLSAKWTGYERRVDNAGSLDPITAGLYYYLDNGDVELDDFNQSADYLGDLTFTPHPNFDLEYFEIDVTNGIHSIFGGVNPYLEFRLESDEYTAFINAGETHTLGRTVDTRYPGPRLELVFKERADSNAVPEPSTMILMSAGLGMLLRRKKSV